ncbi:MAG: hypothetical protein U0794_22770 [Isosphaeraceae bacterium]
MTFTRRAAREMVSRLEALIGERANEVWAGRSITSGTASSAAARNLGFDPNFTILDTEDQMDLLKLAMNDSGLFGTGRLAPKPATIHGLISFAANVGKPLAELVADRTRS